MVTRFSRQRGRRGRGVSTRTGWPKLPGWTPHLCLLTHLVRTRLPPQTHLPHPLMWTVTGDVILPFTQSRRHRPPPPLVSVGTRGYEPSPSPRDGVTDVLLKTPRPTGRLVSSRRREDGERARKGSFPDTRRPPEHERPRLGYSCAPGHTPVGPTRVHSQRGKVPVPPRVRGLSLT